MAKTLKLGSIAALTLLSAISVPRSSSAQSELLIINGTASVDIMDYGSYSPGDYSVSGEPAELSLDYQANPFGYGGNLTMQIFAASPGPFGYMTYWGNEDVSDRPTPTSGSASFFVGGLEGYSGDYFIGSDGSVVADWTRSTYTVLGDHLVIQLTFQGSTVPEPSALAQAGTATVVLIGVGLWRARRRTRLSPAQP